MLSHLALPLRPGGRDALAAVFRRHRILETAISVPGCRRLYLATSDAAVDDSAHVLGVWDDATAYQRWLDHPERGAANDDLRRLRAGADDRLVPGELWTVHHHVVDRPADDAPAA